MYGSCDWTTGTYDGVSVVSIGCGDSDGVLLDGGQDLDVLQGAVGCVVVSVAAGNARAMTHSDRGGGQFCQTLVLTVYGQLI